MVVFNYSKALPYTSLRDGVQILHFLLYYSHSIPTPFPHQTVADNVQTGCALDCAESLFSRPDGDARLGLDVETHRGEERERRELGKGDQSTMIENERNSIKLKNNSLQNMSKVKVVCCVVPDWLTSSAAAKDLMRTSHESFKQSLSVGGFFFWVTLSWRWCCGTHALWFNGIWTSPVGG